MIAGFGGQGIVTAGVVLASAALLEGKRATVMPSYGSEMRGGTARASVIVSPEEVACPVASSADVLVAMNDPSARMLGGLVRSGGWIILNSSLCKGYARDDVRVASVAATEESLRLGDSRVANMVALGALCRCVPVVALESLQAAVVKRYGKDTRVSRLNLAALERGWTLVS